MSKGEGALAALICALLLAATTAATTTKTTVSFFRPWTSNGLRHGFTVAHKAAGSCWTNSLTTGRPDAWRCFIGNDIYDPCFEWTPQSLVAACAETPFTQRVVLLNLKKPLPASGNTTTAMLQPKDEPWGLRLTDGDECSFESGATDVVNGERMNYECRGSGWIVGFPDRSKPLWIAKKIVWPKKHVAGVGIATAVF